MENDALFKQWQQWEFPDSGTWAPFKAITDVTIAELPQTPGAYVIGLTAGKGLNRLLENDPHGILDIGDADNLQLRIVNFSKCASHSGTGGHMTGWRLGSMDILNRMGLRVDQLQVSWCNAKDKKDAYRRQLQVFKNYLQLFGELPPLNYKFNWASFGSYTYMYSK